MGDEAEQQAVKGGRKLTSRLEQKIKDLESQFDDEQRRLVEAEKSQRRTTRRIKELTFSQEEDHKNHERMQELVDKLQNKVKSYKKQIEEAEEIAALNLAKFRKVQADLESSEERGHQRAGVGQVQGQGKRLLCWTKLKTNCRPLWLSR